jgi:hypothetical protein
MGTPTFYTTGLRLSTAVLAMSVPVEKQATNASSEGQEGGTATFK